MTPARRMSPDVAPVSPTSFRALCSALTCALAGLLGGIHLAQFSGVLELTTFATAFPGVTAPLKSRLSGALLLGALVGTPLAGPLCDTRGRGPALALSALLFLLSACAIASAASVPSLLLGRAAAGCAFALGTVAAPAYLAEAAPARARAVYVNLYQGSINGGIVAAQLANARAAPDGDWQAVAAIPAAPAAVMLLLAACAFVEPAAWRARRQAGGSPAASGFAALRADASATARLWISCGLMLSQQLTGVTGVILYAPALLMSLGFSSSGGSGPFWAGAMVGCANLAASVVAMAAIDRVDRRRLLMGGAVVMGVALGVLGAVRWNEGPATAGVAALVAFFVAFAGSFGPLPFLVGAEVLPMRYRGAGMTLGAMVSHASSLAVVTAFLQMERAMGAGVYAAFAGGVAVVALFVHRCVPETRGLTLQDVDALFAQSCSLNSLQTRLYCARRLLTICSFTRGLQGGAAQRLGGSGYCLHPLPSRRASPVVMESVVTF